MALAFLLQKGYTLKDRNWRCYSGEIDLIMCDREDLVFVEVKSRSSEEFGDPEMAIHTKKEERMKNCASEYLESHPIAKDIDIRYDIVAIVWHKHKPEIIHFEDAFW